MTIIIHSSLITNLPKTGAFVKVNSLIFD